MTLVSPPQVQPNTEITAAGVNAGVNALATVINGQLDDTNISSLSGSKIPAGTIPASAADTNSNVETRSSETQGNFIVSGLIWTATTGLGGTMTSGTAYIAGKRLVVASVASKTFTASKDCYVSLDSSGAITYQDVNNNANSPTLPANSIFLAIVVTNGSTVTSVNTGQLGAVAPVVSSRTLMVSDTNGQTIYPIRGQRQVGYMQTTSGTSGYAAAADVTGMTVTIIVPQGRKVKLSTHSLASSGVASGVGILYIYEGATEVGIGTVALANTTNGFSLRAEAHISPTAGVHTYKIRAQNSAGNAMTLNANANEPTWFSAELE